ncbi:MAG: hypothetical protein HRF51_05940 [bacterium]|jgi:asparagine synthase (glutamine-hydrolysing)
MPGIFGLIRKRDTNREENRLLLEGMLSRLAHNSDYTSDLHIDDWFALGQISIPFAGEQKLTYNKEFDAAAAFSGFIYGWKNVQVELAGSTKLKATRLIEIYRHFPESLPEKIDGSFNVAIFDNNNRTAVICNDRFGHRQLYYFEDDRYFLFSTEIKAFLACPSFPRDIDMHGVANFFNYGYPLGDRTFFKHAKFLLGGNIVKFDQKGISFKKYWEFRYDEQSTQTIPEFVEEMDEIYRPIILKRLEGSEQAVVPLSGGLDSRFILSHVVQAGYEPHAITHGKYNCLDHKIAREVAEVLRLKNYRFVEMQPYWLAEFAERFVFLSEGMNNAGPATLLGISREYNLPSRTTAFINGIFGGPTNFGSPYFRSEDIIKDISFDDKLRNLRRSLWGELIYEGHYKMFTDDIGDFFRSDYLPGIAEEFAHSEKVSPWFCDQKDVFFIKNRTIRHMNLVDCNRFIWHDHFALADDSLVDFFLKIPAPLKLSRILLTEYFKNKLPALARVPYQATGVDLYSKPSPWKRKWQRLIARTKHYGERLTLGQVQFYNMKNYAHFSQWYRADKRVRLYFEGILLDDKTYRRGYYRRNVIEKLLKQQRRGAGAFFMLADLLAFELFNRLFMDQK